MPCVERKRKAALRARLRHARQLDCGGDSFAPSRERLVFLAYGTAARPAYSRPHQSIFAVLFRKVDRLAAGRPPRSLTGQAALAGTKASARALTDPRQMRAYRSTLLARKSRAVRRETVGIIFIGEEPDGRLLSRWIMLQRQSGESQARATGMGQAAAPSSRFTF